MDHADGVDHASSGGARLRDRLVRLGAVCCAAAMLGIVATGCDNGAAAAGPSATQPGSVATTTTTERTVGPDAAERSLLAEVDGALAATDTGSVLMAEGDTGEDVVVLQEQLADLGFAPGETDGAYGPGTVAAVEAFQVLAGLSETGTADTETLAALEEYRYDGPVLHAGDNGPEVVELQERLASGPFDPGPTDGNYGTTTVEVVWALEKMAGLPVDGDWGPLDEKAWQMLVDGEIGEASVSHDERWVEVDLDTQVLKVYDPGKQAPALISHVSTGSGVPWSNGAHSGSSLTPVGEFEITRRIAGWRQSSLGIGSLYNPLYFDGGIAFHGARSVPLHPASHGCVRVPMHVAEYLPDELPDGTPVHVHDGAKPETDPGQRPM